MDKKRKKIEKKTTKNKCTYNNWNNFFYHINFFHNFCINKY